jgi:putative membrane protein
MEIQEALVQSSMGHFVIKTLLNAAALFAAASILEGVKVKDFTRALIIALLLSVLNATLGAILNFFAFPLRIITLGIFSFVIDAFLILIAAYFLKGFAVKNFWNAFLLAILLAIFNTILYGVFL